MSKWFVGRWTLLPGVGLRLCSAQRGGICNSRALLRFHRTRIVMTTTACFVQMQKDTFSFFSFLNKCWKPQEVQS